MFKILQHLLMSLWLIVAPQTISAQTSQPAFPGAEGFGANVTLGGRGGTIYKVTNLNDSGAGSLRECAAASGARTCIFSVGGTITLTSPISISNPYITIAGQTAPGGGITLRKSAGGDIFSIKTHDVIMRYIAARPGPGGENHTIQLASNNSTGLYNMIFDHCSFSWGVDSVWETWYQTHNIILQWSFATEGLDCSTHSKGCHSKGVMIGGYAAGEGSSVKGSYDITLHHNLFAHDGERTPLMQFCGIGQVINNVTYNPYWTFAHQQDNCVDKSVNNTVNWIGNYHKRGPDSTSTDDLKIIPADSGSYSNVAHVYLSGNIGPSRTDSTKPDSAWLNSSTSYIVTTPANAPAVTTHSCNSTSSCQAYDMVLADAGNSKGVDCSGNWFARRDSIDDRIVNEVKTGTGHIIDNPSEVGGWATIAAGSTCSDGDNDGLPDAFETRYGSMTANSDNDADGYTNLEEYINGTNPNGSNPPPTVGPTATPGPTSIVSPTATPKVTTTPTAGPTGQPATTITLDNNDVSSVTACTSLGTTTPYCESGSASAWSNSSYTGAHAGANGTTSRMNSCNPSGDYAQWSASIPSTGSWNISAWWTSLPSGGGTSMRISDAIYEIFKGTGTTPIGAATVNQKNNGGVWNSIGTYNFNQGDIVTVRVKDSSAGCSASSDTVSADAIQLTTQGTAPPTSYKGDSNGDGKIDITDYNNWRNGYLNKLTGLINGDFNYSQKVDGVDYVIWITTFNGTPSTNAPTTTPTTVRTPTATPKATTTPLPTTGPTQPPGSGFNFISWSDTETSLTTLAQLSNQAVQLNPEFTIYNGDAEGGQGLSGWQTYLNGNNNNGMSSKTFVVRGNGNTGDSSWSTFFNFQQVATNINAPNFSTLTANQTYSFDYGNSRFIGLDLYDDTIDLNSSQITFVTNRVTDAESRGITNVFLFMHRPLYYADSHSCSPPPNLISIINAHPIIKSSFNGHEHLKAVLNFGPGDTRLAIGHKFEELWTAGAGGDTYPCNTARLSTAMGDYCNKFEGFANVTVNGNNITVDFYQAGSMTPVKSLSFTN